MLTAIAFIIFTVGSVLQIKSNIDLKSKVKELKRIQDDQNIVIVKLMYHKAKDLEDYETCAKIKKTLPKVNVYKIFE